MEGCACVCFSRLEFGITQGPSIPKTPNDQRSGGKKKAAVSCNGLTGAHRTRAQISGAISPKRRDLPYLAKFGRSY